MRAAVQQLLAAGSLARANVGRLHTPLKVTLCLTYRCQYRCRTCNIWQRQPSGELTTAEVWRFVDENRGIRWLDLTGGEIFLRPDLPGIFEAIAATWPELAVVHFATNGFLTDRIVALTGRLASRTSARVVVTVSVDGDEALNDAIRGVRGGFRRQVATFAALRRVPGVEVVFGMTISKHNVGRVAETFRACQLECPGLTIDRFHVNVAQRSSHYYGNAGADLAAPAGETRAALMEYRRLRPRPRSPAAWVEAQYLRGLDRYLATGTTPMPCHALRSSCFIGPSGDVFPCITDDRSMGNLRDTRMRLAPIWTGARARAIAREIWAGRCPQCWTACEAYQSILGNLVRPSSVALLRPA